MRLPHFKKKFVAGALAAGLVMGAGGIAAAYFTATGTGSGSGSVGTPSTWKVTVTNNRSGDITPGGPNETIPFTVTNVSSGHQYLNKVTVSIGTFTYQTNLQLPACTKATFRITTTTEAATITSTTVTFTVDANEAPGATFSTSVHLSMITNGKTQNNCQGVTIPIQVHAT